MEKLKLGFSVLLVMVVLCISSSAHAQEVQETTKENWTAILNKAGMNNEQLYELCSHFPHFNEYQDNSSFSQAVVEWANKYPKEVESFLAADAMAAVNPSPYYLGLSDGSGPQEGFKHSYWDMYLQSGMTKQRLEEIAPHFPEPVVTGNQQVDFDNYEKALEKWWLLYGHEMEAYINAPEIASGNPNYAGYQNIHQVPGFMGAPIGKKRPKLIDTGNPWEDDVTYQLSLQNWYFVYHPEKFEKKFDYLPEQTDFFDWEEYRSSVKYKVEESAASAQEENK